MSRATTRKNKFDSHEVQIDGETIGFVFCGKMPDKKGPFHLAMYGTESQGFKGSVKLAAEAVEEEWNRRHKTA